ncbi:hypothetical protein J3A83DRAFT_4191224 [Scleroderma citrinum]
MYASQVCQDWHNRATQKEAYNLGLINKELLASIKFTSFPFLQDLPTHPPFSTLWSFSTACNPIATTLLLIFPLLADHDPATEDPSHHRGNQGPLSKVTAVMGNNSIPFKPKPLSYAQSVWDNTLTTQTAPYAMKLPFGTSQTLPTAPETTKGGLQIRTAKCYAGTSNIHKAAIANPTFMSAQHVGALTMEPRIVHAANQLLA